VDKEAEFVERLVIPVCLILLALLFFGCATVTPVGMAESDCGIGPAMSVCAPADELDNWAGLGSMLQWLFIIMKILL
jgi:hypothetical protein